MSSMRTVWRIAMREIREHGRSKSFLITTAVTFLLNGKAKATDKKAPFAAKFPTAGLSAQVRVGARVTSGGKVVTLTKSIKRC